MLGVSTQGGFRKNLSQTLVSMFVYLVLRWWHLAFNPRIVPFIIQHHWLMLPRYPIKLSQSQVFQMVGDQSGKCFYFCDRRFHGKKKMVVLLIELDISKGLIPALEIVSENFSFVQSMDYQRLPFHCRRCCKVGHLLKIYLINYSKNIFPNKFVDIFLVFDPYSFIGESCNLLSPDRFSNDKDSKSQGKKNSSSLSGESLNSSFDSFSNDSYHRSQESQRGFYSYMSMVENVKRNLRKLEGADQYLKQDLISLHNMSSTEFSVTEIMNILIPSLSKSKFDPSSSIGLSSQPSMGERNNTPSLSNLPSIACFLPNSHSLVFEVVVCSTEKSSLKGRITGGLHPFQLPKKRIIRDKKYQPSHVH